MILTLPAPETVSGITSRWEMRKVPQGPFDVEAELWYQPIRLSLGKQSETLRWCGRAPAVQPVFRLHGVHQRGNPSPYGSHPINI